MNAQKISQHPLEVIPEGEAEMIEHVTKIQLEMMKNKDPQKRGQHPKQQALLRGIFEISDSVPESILTIPPQDFTAPEQFEFCENLSYNPWHCASDHQPLGGIQRCRKLVYEEGAKLRHELNDAQNSEPTKADYDRLGSFL
ncbi:hypothetical protein [Pleurocapsa sp. PCC 7319]|uniref:hypothetical protein n=1 Tax=Pleurocapsa sp. PCC 7319 TaxID=118161 RepID=UPI00034DB1E0|nr:hypothetical protein [Pleurocapsa sp. PCC 7319]